MRFTNPRAMLNNLVRVQSEVAAMTLFRRALTSISPSIVPEVYAWNPDSTAQGGDGWALLEHMPGSRMELGGFKKLKKEEKRWVLGQIAEVVRLVQGFEVKGGGGYGGFRFGEGGEVELGPTPIRAAGRRCETYWELYGEYLRTQVGLMDECDVVKGWKGEGDGDLRGRIDRFIEEGFAPLMRKAAEERPKPVLVHGDFDLHNLLFTSDNRISALLDYDFAHVASATDEYFYSFQCINSLVAPLTPEPSLNKLRDALLHGFEETKSNRKFEDMVNWEVADMTDQAFSNAGVRRPIDLMPGIETLADLYWFIQNISPGCFFMPGFREKCPPARLEAIKAESKDGLENTLSSWGY